MSIVFNCFYWGSEFMDNIQNETFYNKVIELFQNAKKNLSTAVNMTMVYSYYKAGRMIVEEEQGVKERAAYGKYILKELSQRLTQKFGRGYSYDNLKLMRKFYLVYSKDSIGETPFPQSEKLPVTQEGRKFYLSWSHYLILMRISNVDERHFYEIILQPFTALFCIVRFEDWSVKTSRYRADADVC